MLGPDIMLEGLSRPSPTKQKHGLNKLILNRDQDLLPGHHGMSRIRASLFLLKFLARASPSSELGLGPNMKNSHPGLSHSHSNLKRIREFKVQTNPRVEPTINNNRVQMEPNVVSDTETYKVSSS